MRVYFKHDFFGTVCDTELNHGLILRHYYGFHINIFLKILITSYRIREICDYIFTFIFQSHILGKDTARLAVICPT
jgi:hypothetical protein